MTIYEHTTSVTAAGGTIATATLNIPGGLLRHVLIRANTDTTQFMASLANDDGTNVVDWGVHECEINDWNITVPVAGEYTLTIRNASIDDTFDVLLGVQE